MFDYNYKRLVSIVMPAYNAEKWIGGTLSSLIAQTSENWELCVVDDASTDTTWEILQSYQTLWGKRIKLARNERNLGCGLTRRKAISMASGRYIAFLDADDRFAPEFIEKMVQTIEENDADVSVCGVKEYNEGKYQQSFLCDEPYVASKETIFRQYMGGWIMQYNSNKVFKREVIEKHEYCDSRFCEDSRTTYKWLWAADKVAVIPDRLFSYYKHEDSNSHNGNSPLQKSYDTLLCVSEHFDFCLENGMTDLLMDYIRYAQEHLTRCVVEMDTNDAEYKVVNEIRTKFENYVRERD